MVRQLRIANIDVAMTQGIIIISINATDKQVNIMVHLPEHQIKILPFEVGTL